MKYVHNVICNVAVNYANQLKKVRMKTPFLHNIFEQRQNYRKISCVTSRVFLEFCSLCIDFPHSAILVRIRYGIGRIMTIRFSSVRHCIMTMCLFMLHVQCSCDINYCYVTFTVKSNSPGVRVKKTHVTCVYRKPVTCTCLFFIFFIFVFENYVSAARY